MVKAVQDKFLAVCDRLLWISSRYFKMWQNIMNLQQLFQNLTKYYESSEDISKCDRILWVFSRYFKMWQNVMNFQQIFQNVTECYEFSADISKYDRMLWIFSRYFKMWHNNMNFQQIFQKVTNHSALSHSLVAMATFFCICTLECGQKLWKFRYMQIRSFKTDFLQVYLF